jgi:hypothetical protein
LLAPVASAGTLQVRDDEHLLSSDDRGTLQQEAASYPFDVRVLTSESHSGDFDHYVGEQVGAPNMVVIGIDKEHRRTSVHFGTATRIAPSEFHAIEQAGNASFKSGDFRAGIDAILNRAKESVGTAPAVVDQPRSSVPAPLPQQHANGGFPFGWVILGGLVLLAFLALRRVFSGGGSSMYSQNQANGGWGPGYGQGPGYGPGPGYGGGGSGLGSGLLGAGLGGLAGYELGKAAGEREEHERGRDGGMLGGGSNDDSDRDRSNWDEGGDSGGWDDSSGGGGDWGGGGDGGGGDSGGW